MRISNQIFNALTLTITLLASSITSAQIRAVAVWDYGDHEAPTVAINDNGVVSFVVASTSGEVQKGVYRGTPLSGISRLKSPTSIESFGDSSAINNTEQLCFWAEDIDGVQHIFRATGDVVESMAENTGNFAGYGFLDMPAMNNLGTVAFTAVNGTTDSVGVFRRDVGALTTIVERIQTQSNHYNPDINDSGDVAFYWNRLDGSPFPREIWTGDGLNLVSRLRSSQKSNSTRRRTILINENSTVTARFAGTNNANDLYVRGDGVNTDILVDGEGLFRLVGGGQTTTGQVSWNNADEFVFRASVTASGQIAIFNGLDPLENALLKFGDPLAGSRVVNVNLGRWGLNEVGQVAFSAKLEDGRTGVFVSERCGATIQGRRGDFVSGSEESLTVSDNEDMVFSRGDDSALGIVEVDIREITGNQQVDSIDFLLECSVFSRAPVTQTVSLFNFETNSYESIDSRGASRFNDQTVVASPSGGDLNRFVDKESSCLKARLTFRAQVDRTRFSVRIDRGFFTVN